MAKTMYKIPYDLDASYGDMEISFQSKDGVGTRPLPVKVILMYLGSAFLCFYVCTHSFISRGNAFQIILFVLIWLMLTLVLAKYDTTRRMQIQLIPVLLNYIPKASRHVITRSSKSANGFMQIAGILSIDDNGMVSYTDGTFGYWYRVVGSASVLLFDADKQAILDRVDMFYRKLDTDVEVGFVTDKESQKVFRQIASLKRRFDNLTVRDPDLLLIADEQYGILKDYVGSSFQSIHQYMFIKGDNKEALLKAKNIIQAEVEGSALLLKQCVPMDRADVAEPLRTIYKGGV